MTSTCAQCPCPIEAEDVKGRVHKTAHCPTCAKGIEACPFPCSHLEVIRYCFGVFINPTTFYPITTNLTVQRKVVPEYVAGDSPKWPQAVPTLSINSAISGLYFCLLFRKVCPSLAMPVSQQGHVNPHTACVKLYLWKLFVWGLTRWIWILWKHHL